MTACSDKTPDLAVITPPVARIVPQTFSIHGHERVDDYFWIRDDTRQDPEVLDLLQRENAYTQQVMSHTETLQDELFAEITNRLTSSNSTVPVKQGDYYYHREFRKGGEYPLYLRRKEHQPATILLDLNELAKGHDYYNVGNWVVSPDSQKLAYAEDILSRRVYTLRFKDLQSETLLPDVIYNADTSIAWANDNKTVFYVLKDPTTLRPYRLMKHTLGTTVESDQLIYEEQDARFYVSAYTTRSKKYVVISMQSTDSSEIRLIDADQPEAAPVIFLARENNHEYRLRHIPGEFYILTNWQAKNFRLMQVDEHLIGSKTHWQTTVAHQPEVLIQDVELFNDHLVLTERYDGLPRIRVFDQKSDAVELIQFPDPAYTARLHSNPEINSNQLRYVYSSLTTPRSVYEYNMATGVSTRLKQDKVVGEFDAANYRSERLKVTVRDGAEVPVSLVYRKDLKNKARQPLYLYGYGSYGSAIEPRFSSTRLSLLDRGFVFAMVHVRGGDEMGRRWYEDGKLQNKRNTFWDFIDVTEALVAKGYGDQQQVFAMGGSAGGLLMGVIANEAPEKYLGIIAHVPFVDLVTTMLDASIPLTTGEYTEWGNPEVAADYRYMLSYSPYDQIKPQHYPHMFVTTGLYDSQVQYFEPVKWVSKLRRYKLDDHRLLMHIDMTTGHGGASGRYARYKKSALEFAFILDLLAD
ncbi:MAG: S9 family peptidase [Pseudomonadales bacterium]|nr:S9 family peptidase [Pseudomonadales bacterium]